MFRRKQTDYHELDKRLQAIEDTLIEHGSLIGQTRSQIASLLGKYAVNVRQTRKKSPVVEAAEQILGGKIIGIVEQEGGEENEHPQVSP